MNNVIFSLLAVFPAASFAQEASPAAAGSPFASLMPLLLIFVVFYMFLIRPQQKRMKEHQGMLSALKKGDEVITGGGIVGKVVKVSDDKVTVEIANGVEVTAVKATLQQVVNSKAEPSKPAHQEKKKSEKNDNRLPSKDQIANDN